MPTQYNQDNWRWCNKCQGLWFNGNPSKGPCPKDGKNHSDSGSSNYTLTANEIALLKTLQTNWRWCDKCQGLWFAGNAPSMGACPAGGGHQHTSPDGYTLTYNTTAGAGTQGNWRWCDKCQGLWFAGNAPSMGACPAGGGHTHSGSGDYILIYK
jgi:hypothetical protein